MGEPVLEVTLAPSSKFIEVVDPVAFVLALENKLRKTIGTGTLGSQ
jgi:hypothetical protein